MISTLLPGYAASALLNSLVNFLAHTSSRLSMISWCTECSDGLVLFSDELLQNTLRRYLVFRSSPQACHPLLLGSCLPLALRYPPASFSWWLFLRVAVVVRYNCSMLTDSEAPSWILATPQFFTFFLSATTFALCFLSVVSPTHDFCFCIVFHASTPPAWLYTHLSVATHRPQSFCSHILFHRWAVLLQDAVADTEVPLQARLVSQHQCPSLSCCVRSCGLSGCHPWGWGMSGVAKMSLIAIALYRPPSAPGLTVLTLFAGPPSVRTTMCSLLPSLYPTNVASRNYRLQTPCYLLVAPLGFRQHLLAEPIHFATDMFMSYSVISCASIVTNQDPVDHIRGLRDHPLQDGHGIRHLFASSGLQNQFCYLHLSFLKATVNTF